MFESSAITGSPPGTIIYKGRAVNSKVRITLIEFNEQELIEKEFFDFDDCMLNVKPGMVKWINVDGVHDPDLIQRIGDKFGVHQLTLEDIGHTDQRPKFEDYDSYLVSIMKMLTYEEEIINEQLTIILLNNNMVLSFQEFESGDAFDLIRNRIRQGKGRIRKMDASYLSYCLMDAVVDLYFVILEKIGDRIEDLEDDLIDQPSDSTMKALHALKREVIFLRKAVWPMRDLIGNMERSENSLIKKPVRIFLRDVYDHTIRVIDTVETQRDLLSGMMDVLLSSMSNKMNEVMKVLTIISTIFIPVTFIAGVYGMNFKYMPELQSPMGYWATWAVMITMMATMLIFFRVKKWI